VIVEAILTYSNVYLFVYFTALSGRTAYQNSEGCRWKMALMSDIAVCCNVSPRFFSVHWMINTNHCTSHSTIYWS